MNVDHDIFYRPTNENGKNAWQTGDPNKRHKLWITLLHIFSLNGMFGSLIIKYN